MYARPFLGSVLELRYEATFYRWVIETTWVELFPCQEHRDFALEDEAISEVLGCWFFKLDGTDRTGPCVSPMFIDFIWFFCASFGNWGTKKVFSNSKIIKLLGQQNFFIKIMWEIQIQIHCWFLAMIGIDVYPLLYTPQQSGTNKTKYISRN